jgi:hypothetical protein
MFDRSAVRSSSGARWLALTGLLGACTNDTGFNEQTNEEVFYQEPTDQVDILYVVDNSNSMRNEQEALAAGFGSFIEEINNTNTDFQIGVITTSFEYDDATRGQLLGNPKIITKTGDYVAMFEQRALVGVDGSGKEKGLEAAQYALSPLTTANAGFLRNDAFLLVVFVSDEEDCSDAGALEGLDNKACYLQKEELTPVSEFVLSFRDIKSRADQVQIGAIVGPETDGCEESVPGRRYMELTRYVGGLVGNICEPDWSSMLYDLGLNATGVRTQFRLEYGAKDGTLEVIVDEDADGPAEPVTLAQDPQNGWTYDAATQTVFFHGDGVPPRGASVQVKYTKVSGSGAIDDTDATDAAQ